MNMQKIEYSIVDACSEFANFDVISILMFLLAKLAKSLIVIAQIVINSLSVHIAYDTVGILSG